MKGSDFIILEMPLEFPLCTIRDTLQALELFFSLL